MSRNIINYEVNDGVNNRINSNINYALLQHIVVRSIDESVAAKESLKNQAGIISEAAILIAETLKNSGKILICGNGGSAADSQHFAAEIVGRFKMERKGLPAIALSTDTSILTAIGNDYGFEKIFSRQVEALGNEGDILICISTSGNSQNIIEAAKYAQNKKMKIICLLGKDGGKLKEMSDLNIIVGNDTPRIQESHILAIHIICDIVERRIVES